jgi:hypothetical protein
MITREIKVGDKIRWLAGPSGSNEFVVYEINRTGDSLIDTEGDEWSCVFSRPEQFEHVDEPQADPVNHSGSKYLRTIQLIEGKVDVYAMLVAFDVRCPARQHAIKKLLCAGLRGKGDELQDLHEAGDAVRRAIQIAEAGKCE